MGLGKVSPEVEATTFKTASPAVGKAICSKPSSSVSVSENLANFAKIQPPWDFEAAKAELETIIGVGRAGSLKSMGGVEMDGKGKLQGPINAVEWFGLNMLYRWASDIPYLNATADQMYRFIQWHHYSFALRHLNSDTATQNAKLLHRVLDDLASKPHSTSVYVGHDNNLAGMAALLNFSWGGYEEPARFRSTLPGSALLFEEDGGEVTVSWLYRMFDDRDAATRLHRVPVWASGGLEELRAVAAVGLERYPAAKTCFDSLSGAVSV